MAIPICITAAITTCIFLSHWLASIDYRAPISIGYDLRRLTHRVNKTKRAPILEPDGLATIGLTLPLIVGVAVLVSASYAWCGDDAPGVIFLGLFGMAAAWWFTRTPRDC